MKYLIDIILLGIKYFILVHSCMSHVKILVSLGAHRTYKFIIYYSLNSLFIIYVHKKNIITKPLTINTNGIFYFYLTWY